MVSVPGTAKMALRGRVPSEANSLSPWEVWIARGGRWGRAHTSPSLAREAPGPLPGTLSSQRR